MVPRPRQRRDSSPQLWPARSSIRPRSCCPSCAESRIRKRVNPETRPHSRRLHGVPAGPARGSDETRTAASIAGAVAYPAAIALPGLAGLVAQSPVPAVNTTHLPLDAAETLERVSDASFADAIPYPASIVLPGLMGAAEAETRRAPEQATEAEAAETLATPSLAGAIVKPGETALPGFAAVSAE